MSKIYTKSFTVIFFSQKNAYSKHYHTAVEVRAFAGGTEWQLQNVSSFAGQH
jgi:hypothetical protein